LEANRIPQRKHPRYLGTVDQIVSVDAKLVVGQVSETVEVTGGRHPR